MKPKKEEPMTIYHWVEQSDLLDSRGELIRNWYEPDSDMVMVITNDPTEDRKQAYGQALMGPGSVQYNEVHDLWLMPVRTGNWRFHYLERLSQRGVKFTLTMRRMGLMLQSYEENAETQETITLGDMIIQSGSLCWADATNVYILDVHGVQTHEFDWSLVGLEVNDSKKMAKRLQELTRLSKWAIVDRPLRTKTIAPEVASKDPEFWVKAFDGKNIVRMGALPQEMQDDLQKSGIRHVMGRGFTWTMIDDTPTKVLIKGDFVVVDDKFWRHEKIHVVAHAENAKTEVVLCTSGEWVGHEDLWTFWSHDPLHIMSWDQQTMGNYPRIFSLSKMKDDYLAEMQGISQSLEAGFLPGQAEEDVETEESHDEFRRLMPTPGEIGKARDLTSQMRKAGLDIRMFQNLTYLSLNGFANSKAKFIHMNEWLDADKTKKDPLYGKHEKHVVTMRNAFRATCITDTFMKHFMGVPYPEIRRASFDPRYGMIWHGEHFARAFELHGTHDLDDAHGFVPKKFWSSSEKTVELLKEHGVLLPEVEIPDNPDEAKMMLKAVRLPNGSGEYSIMEFDFFTWPSGIPFDEDLVETIDLNFAKGWPKPQGMLIPANMPGLPTSRVYSKKSYTRTDFVEDFWAQSTNPGFGAVCNALLTYSIATGGGIPKCMPDSLGNVVDATQQGADAESFKAINDLMEDIKEEMTYLNAEIPRYEYYRRGSIARKAVALGGISVRGNAMMDFDEQIYSKEYNTLLRDIKTKYGFAMRKDVSVNQEILKELSFTPKQLDWARSFIITLERNILAVDTSTTPKMTKFTKPLIEAVKREQRHKVVDEAIALLESFEKTGHAALLLWYATLKPKCIVDGAIYTMGYNDRAICQMGSTRSIAHLVIDAIADWKEGKIVF